MTGLWLPPNPHKPSKCEFCGGIHAGVCARVKAICYDEMGRIRRVEFLTPADCAVDVYVPEHLMPQGTA